MDESGKVRYGSVWCGKVEYGKVRCGWVRYGAAWFGKEIESGAYSASLSIK